MKTHAITLFLAFAVALVSCDRVKAPSGANPEPYLKVLNEGFSNTNGFVSFPKGEITIMSGLSSSVESGDPEKMKFPIQYLERLQKAERDGFIRLNEKQQGLLEQLGNEGARFFTVTPTDKLLSMSDESKSDEKWKRVRVSQFKVLEILSEEPCKLRRATPGDEFRLVVGRLQDVPTEHAKTLGTGYCTTETQELKFRAVLQFNPFNKEYTFVIVDTGKPDDAGWKSDYVARIIER